MPAMANIEVYDGASTPVLHTLIPVAEYREKGVTRAVWREELPDLPMAAQVRCEVSQQKLRSGVIRSEITTVVPVMEQIAGGNSSGYVASGKVAYEDKFTTVAFTTERSSIGQRRLAKQIHANILMGYISATTPDTTRVADALFSRAITPV